MKRRMRRRLGERIFVCFLSFLMVFTMLDFTAFTSRAAELPDEETVEELEAGMTDDLTGEDEIREDFDTNDDAGEEPADTGNSDVSEDDRGGVDSTSSASEDAQSEEIQEPEITEPDRADDEIVALTLDEEVEATVSNYNLAWYSFTAEQAGVYQLNVSGEADTYKYVRMYLSKDDDRYSYVLDGDSYDVGQIQTCMNAGDTVYFGVYTYSESTVKSVISAVDMHELTEASGISIAQKDIGVEWFHFTAKEDGMYIFSATEVDSSVSLLIYNSPGRYVKTQYGRTIRYSLAKGEQIWLSVGAQYDMVVTAAKEQDYELLWADKSLDITNETDSMMEYFVKFKAPESGNYRFVSKKDLYLYNTPNDQQSLKSYEYVNSQYMIEYNLAADQVVYVNVKYVYSGNTVNLTVDSFDAVPMDLDTVTTVALDDVHINYYSFTAPENGIYMLTFQTSEEAGSYNYDYVYIYDEIGGKLVENGSSTKYDEEITAYKYKRALEKDQTIYFKVVTSDENTVGGSITIEKKTGKIEEGKEDNTYVLSDEDFQIDLAFTPSYRAINWDAALSSKDGSLSNTYRVKLYHRKKGDTEWLFDTSYDSVKLNSSNSYHAGPSSTRANLEQGTVYEYMVKLDYSTVYYPYESDYSTIAEFEGVMEVTTKKSDSPVILDLKEEGLMISAYVCLLSEDIKYAYLKYREKGEKEWKNATSVSSSFSETTAYISTKTETEYEFQVVDQYTGEGKELLTKSITTGKIPVKATVTVDEDALRSSSAQVTVDLSEYSGNYAGTSVTFYAGIEYTNIFGDKAEDLRYPSMKAPDKSLTFYFQLSNLEAGKEYELPIWISEYENKVENRVSLGTVKFTTKDSVLKDRVEFDITNEDQDPGSLKYTVSVTGDTTGLNALYTYYLYYQAKGGNDDRDYTTGYLEDGFEYKDENTLSNLYYGTAYDIWLLVDGMKITKEDVMTLTDGVSSKIELEPLSLGAKLKYTLEGASEGSYTLSASVNNDNTLYFVKENGSRDYNVILSEDNNYSGEWIIYSYYGDSVLVDAENVFTFKLRDNNTYYYIFNESRTLKTSKLNFEVTEEKLTGSKAAFQVKLQDPDDYFDENNNRYVSVSVYYREKGSEEWKEAKDKYGYSSNFTMYRSTKKSVELTGLKPETTYELNFAAYDKPDAAYSITEFTTPEGIAEGTFSDMKVSFSGYHVKAEGKYVPSDFAESTSIYLVAQDKNGKEIASNKLDLYSDNSFYTYSDFNLAPDTAGVVVMAVENCGYDDKYNPIEKKFTTKLYSWTNKPDAKFTASNPKIGVSTVTFELSYTGNLQLSEYDSQYVYYILRYGTDAKEEDWEEYYSYESFSSDSDRTQLVTISGLEPETKYYGKLEVGIRAYDEEEEDYVYYYGNVLDLKSFTTKKNVEYSVSAIFPDEEFRKYVLDAAWLDPSETVITTADLENVTYISQYRDMFSAPVVKDLSGLEYLTELTSLTLSNHEVADVTEIDWSKLTKLTSLNLRGNELEKLPDLSQNVSLKNVDFDYNKLSADELKKASSKLPAGVTLPSDTQKTQRVGGISIITEDTYYQRGGKSPLAVKVSGYKSGLPYTFKYKVDGTEKILDKGYDVKYNIDTEIAVGDHTLTVEMYGGDKENPIESKTVKFKMAAGSTFTGKEKYYYTPLTGSFSPEIYSEKKVKEIYVLTGSTVIAQNLSPYTYETSSERRYSKLELTYLEDSKVWCCSTSADTLKYADPAAGTYDVKLVYADDTTETISKLIEITDKARITGGDIAYGYDGMGDYFYLNVSGFGFDPSKLTYSFEDYSDGKEYAAEYVSFKETDDGYIIKLKKGSGWKNDILANRGTYVKVKVGAKSDYTVAFENDTFYADISSGIYYFRRNMLSGKIEIGLSSDYVRAGVTYSLKRYASMDDYYNNPTEGEMVVIDLEDAKGDIPITYLIPMKEGEIYRDLPAGYYVVEVIPDETSSLSKKYDYFAVYGSSDDVYTNYWSGPNWIYQGTESASFAYSSAILYVEGADESKFTAELTGGTLTEPVEIKPLTFSTYPEDNAAKKKYDRISMVLNTKSLEVGSYTITVYYDGKEEISNKKSFNVVPTDKFIITSSFSGSWKGDDNFTIDLYALNIKEDDKFTVSLTDMYGKTVTGLTTTATRWYSDTNVLLTVKGLQRASAYKYYYMVIKCNGKEAYQIDGKTKYFSDDKGAYTRIYGSKGFSSTTTYINGYSRMTGITIYDGVTYPVQLSIYKPYDAEPIAEVSVKKGDVIAKTYYSDYYFQQDLIAKLSEDPDALYEVVAVSANGRVGRWTSEYVSLDPSNAKPATGITLTDTAKTLYVGQSGLIGYSIQPAGAFASISWSSSDEKVATVNSEGRVTAVAPGKATITATISTSAGPKSATCTVEVKGEALKIKDTSIPNGILYEGQTKEISYALTPEDSASTVTWKSSNTKVATVAADKDAVTAKVTAVKAGEVTITATASSGAESSITITVKPEELKLSTTSKKLYINDSFELTAALLPEDSKSVVTWKVTKGEGVISLEGTGDSRTVTALGTDGKDQAEAEITVSTSTGAKAVCTVTVQPEKITISSASKELELYVGKTAQIFYTIDPSDSDSVIEWASKDEKIATVDENGLVTAVGKGTTVITAVTARGGKAEVKVTVDSLAVAEITLNKTSLSLGIGHEELLFATILPANASNKKVTWNSSDEKVVKVEAVEDADGLTQRIVAVASGTAKVTVTTEDGSKTAECEVTVVDYKISGTDLTLDLAKNETKTLSVTDNSDKAVEGVTWQSDDSSVATVDNTGLVTPVGVGLTVIRAKFKADGDDLELTRKVTVINNALVGIGLDETELTLAEGSSKKLKLSVDPLNTTLKLNVEWSSSDENVTVTKDPDSDLVAVVAVAEGAKDATITVNVSAEGVDAKTATCKIKVVKKNDVETIKVPDDLWAITNVQPFLSDVKYDEKKWAGWSWSESANAETVKLDQFVGMSQKEFAAVYKRTGYEDYETSVAIDVVKLSKLNIDVAGGTVVNGNVTGTAKASLVWNFVGDEKYADEILSKLKENGIDVDHIEWKSDKPGVVEVKPVEGKPAEQTLQIKDAGAAKITATVKKNDGTVFFAATIPVTVKKSTKATISVIDSGNLTGADNKYTGILADSTSRKETITFKLSNVEKGKKLTVASNNPSVVKIGKVTQASDTKTEDTYDYTFKAEVTLNAAGTAKLTVKANDAMTTTECYYISVTDPKPVLGDATAVLNLNKEDKAATFYFYPNEGYEVEQVEVTDGDSCFNAYLVSDGEYGWNLGINSKNEPNPGTYKLQLQATADGKKFNYAVTVKVQNSAPAFKLKQSKKVNLFYTDETGNGILTIETAEKIESVEWIPAEGSKCTLEEVQGSTNAWYLEAASIGNKKGKISIHFEGYSASADKTFTVGTENKAPKLTLGNKAATFYPTMGTKTAAVKVMLDGAVYEGAGLTVEGAAGYSYEYDPSDGMLRFAIDTANPGKATAKITVKEDNWANGLTANLNLAVSTKKPALKLSKTQVVLNMNDAFKNYDQAELYAAWKDGSTFEPDWISVSAADAKAAALLNKNIVFDTDTENGQIIAGLTGDTSGLAAGTYKFNVQVKANAESDYITKAALKVKIDNKAQEDAVTVSAKGSINILDRNSYVTLTPTYKCLNGVIVPENEDNEITLIGEAAHLFDARFNPATGKIEIYAKEDVNLIVKYKYGVKLQLQVMNASGETTTVTTKELKLVVKQIKPTVKAAMKNSTFYSGVYNSRDINFSAAYKQGAAEIEKVELVKGTDSFRLVESSGTYTLVMDKYGNAAKGKSCALQFRVTIKGQADNVAVYTVNYTVKVK